MTSERDSGALWGFAPFRRIEPGFIGRDRELATLFAGFSSGQAFGVINGRTGVGKTSLAHAFEYKGGDELFPGGFMYSYGFPEFEMPELPEQISGSERALLVCDEAHVLDTAGESQISHAMKRYPNLSVLAITQYVSPFLQGADLVLDLGSFSYGDVFKILESRLGKVDQTTVQRLYEKLGGNPVAIVRAALSVHRGDLTWEEVIAGISNFEYSGLIGPDGSTLSSDSSPPSEIIVDITSINEELLQRLRSQPALWRELPPRRFEEAVAELLHRMGYSITLTPTTKDGGFDMYAAKKDGLGSFLYLVECKRYTPPNKVGVEVVRSLSGVLSEHRATGGAVVTTSFFTSGAKEFQQKFEHQLKLHDYLVLQKWMSTLN